MEYFINQLNFGHLVKKLLETSRDKIQSINLFGYRTVEPFKSCFFAIDEVVSQYFGEDKEAEMPSLTFLGARGCDLEALEVTDRVFGEGDFKDPFYLKRREKVFIIGADCTACGATCFCTLVKGKPWVLQRYDLNLSPIEGGYIVEAGTDRGKKFIQDNRSLFEATSEAGMQAKVANRQKVLQQLAEVNRPYQFKQEFAASHRLNLENSAWKYLTKDCVECSACNLICPTCTCFLLADTGYQGSGAGDRGEFERHKIWDACLKSGYQRVAGGSNPRGKLSYERLKRYTCVGCGRCIDGCAGNIDMRKIFAELERQAPLTAKLV
jgi:sulfhydrogenase subunit beta (sulfur reductase)